MNFSQRYRLCAVGFVLLLVGCETLVSDIATRIRFELRDAAQALAASPDDTITFHLEPNGFPDGCQSGAGYQVTLSPYQGGKAVAVGDIIVQCQGGRSYGTGLEGVTVAQTVSVEIPAKEAIKVTLRKSAIGIEVVALE
jgi:hypothetical protein